MDSIKDIYEKQGYVIVQDLIPPKSFEALKQACDRVVEKTRSGEWKERRIVGKQFPPFDTEENRPDVWGVQHVMHPALNEPEFVKWYGSTKLVETLAVLMGCTPEELQMELFNLLINPSSHNFALRWHRDDVREDATEEQEREALGVSSFGIQWNTALYDDDCLYVVPGSHKTPRTDAQRKLSSTQIAPEDPLEMPGAIQVHLKAGETAIYQNNILHTARYSTSTKRATLHACMGDSRGGLARARITFQHGLDWMRDEEFVRTFDKVGTNDQDDEIIKGKDRLKAMWGRLRELDRKIQESGQNVGFSLVG